VTLSEYDKDLRSTYGKFIIGCDESGRGAWCGSLVAAAVCLPEGVDLPGVMDSKKISSLERRLKLAEEIKRVALAWNVAEINAVQIDRKGVNWANSEAMLQCCQIVTESLGDVSLYVVDQTNYFRLNPHIMFPKADSTSLSVAAASILAKTYRDQQMIELSERYPEYKFEEHKGYVNDVHKLAVSKHGKINGLHRKSFNVEGFGRFRQVSLSDFEN
jgi:ribonuclease HII